MFHNGTTVSQPIFIIKQLKKNLLGLPAIKVLNLLAIVESIEDEIPNKYPSLFTGLGIFPDTYAISLHPDAHLYALFTSRNIPLLLRQKKDNSVRISVDFRQLNESVLREVHPLPKVKDNLAQLHGAEIFSKVDANCRFWQVPLDKGSKPLTTFITLFGKYNFKKLPFGISSAPTEHFQRQTNKILSGLPGT